MTPLVLAAAAALSMSAATFDNAGCKAFLAGTWDMAVETDMNGQTGRIVTRASYGADGAFRATVRIEPPGMAASETALTGTWDAAPGPSTDSCNAAVAIDGQAPMSTTLIVLDADTVRSEDGSLARRAAAATPVN
jgi:hypothetical protein